MIRPILEYGDVIIDNLPAGLCHELESVQQRAALACADAFRLTKYSILLKELGWDLLTT